MRAEIYQQMQKIEAYHWWFCARRNILARLIGQYYPKGCGRILDAGCGTGGNLQMLSQFGQVTGVEMDAEAAQMAREKRAGAVVEGYLPNNFPISEGDVYELIVALDVLEHIDDDVASLARLKTLLSPGGRMLVTVPAFPGLWSSHDEAHHHKRRYTRLDLQQKIELAGLRSSYISYFNSLLFPATALVRSLQKRRSGREDKGVLEVEVSVPGRWLNRVLYSLFVLEKYVIGKLALPFGLSLVAVIELPPEGESQT